MAERGRTKGCKPLFSSMTDTYREIANKCGLDETSIRKFRDGKIVIRRTTFNKVCQCLTGEYGIELNPDDHWIEVSDSSK